MYRKRNYTRKPGVLKKSRYALDMATTYGTPFFKTGPRAWPEQMTATLPYCEEIALNAGPGSYASATYRANDMFDPFYGIGGHQPYGFDQYTNVYNYYGVESSDISVYYSPSAVSDQIPGYIAVIHSASASAPTWAGVEHFLEYCKDQKVKVYLFGGYNQGLHYNGHKLGACKATFNLPKMNGTNTADSNTWGTGTTLIPTFMQEYFHVISYSANGNDPATLPLRVEINYKARFFNKQVLPRST